MVSSEGACAAYYNYGRFAREREVGMSVGGFANVIREAIDVPAGGRMSAGASSNAAAPDREQRILGIIETARAKRPKFRDAQITMAHGAGGKATPPLIEGLFVPAFESARPGGDWETPGTVPVDGRPVLDDHRLLRRDPDPVPRGLDR